MNTKNLTTVDSPSFLLNFPSSFDSTEKNNIWMQESSSEDLIVDKEVAIAQWTDLYNVLSANGLVTILPTPYDCKLQDLVFVANMGIVIDKDNVVISNFTSAPRIGETAVGEAFFKLAGYKNVHVCPFKFEGLADMKWLKDKIYIGGYGVRSDIRAYEWMEQQFGIRIIKVKMGNPYLYHLDCSIFPITQKDVMVATDEYTKIELDEISRYAEIIHVPTKYAKCGVTNNVRCHNFILNSSDFYDLDPILDKDDYKMERDKNQFLEDICVSYALEPLFINTSSFMAGGGLMSCLVLELNHFSYNIELL